MKKYKRLNDILGRQVDTYLPFYDEYADFNTNAKSYYDYLARYNKVLEVITELINDLARRNIKVSDTKSIEFKKIGDWIDNGKCPESFDDIIELLANVKISMEKEKVKLDKLKKEIQVSNGISIKNDGLFAKDYTEVIDVFDNEIYKTNETIKDIEKNINEKIKEIERLIKEIETIVNDNDSIIDSILGLNLKELEYGKHYNIEFHNGFYTDTADLVVKVGETSTSLNIRVFSDSAEGKALKHKGDLREQTTLSLRPDKDIPEKSKIFTIRFVGAYSKYNTQEVIMDNTPSVLWHIRPLKARASWGNLITAHNINNEFVFSWRHIEDGYSNQLVNSYDDALSLQFGNVNCDITIRKGDS